MLHCKHYAFAVCFITIYYYIVSRWIRALQKCSMYMYMYVAHEYLLAPFLQNVMAGDATRSLCGILVTRFLICNSPVLRHTRFEPVCCIYQARCMYVNV